MNIFLTYQVILKVSMEGKPKISWEYYPGTYTSTYLSSTDSAKLPAATDLATYAAEPQERYAATTVRQLEI